MKKALLSLFFLVSINSYSQNWSPPGANWKYTYFWGNTTGYVEIKYLSDTVINGQNAKILEKSRTVYNGSNGQIGTYVFGTEYTYEDNGVVYMLNNVNIWDTLYNFDANVGDSWKIVKQNFSPHCGSDAYLLVTDTGTKIINGITLKYLVLEFHPGYGIPPYVYKDTIFEKVGFINSYMKPFDVCNMTVDANEGGWFRCYYDDNFTTYKANYTNECDSIFTSNSENELPFGLSVYPNPVTSTLKLETNLDLYNYQYKIFNTTGTLIKEGNLSAEINVSDLTKGIYFLKLFNFKGEKNLKFVKK